MITCPICGVYWDYLSELPKSVKSFLPTAQQYRVKEQGDCIAHVAQQHSTKILIEILEKSMDEFKWMIKTISN